ncbi:hypothetical protein M9H77_30001 [Catharanthus roseus]|uniref:Uncharacterized protein n=1 Tax=Catharanthus roseus TaxID=4058 RepID=A0ACB9ZY05_CATRO|nr:hypothetical protein M9H77_30001 [Catharanthus roseus]
MESTEKGRTVTQSSNQEPLTESILVLKTNHIVDDTLVEAYCIPNSGSRVAKKGDVLNIKGYNELSFKREVLGNPKVKEGDGIKFSQMKLHGKVLHRLITSYISPKNGSYQYVNGVELCVIWQMKLHGKVLHRLITSYISPKNGSYQYVNGVELCIIWHVHRKRDLNLCYLMMENRKVVIKKGGVKALPYGIILTELFSFLGVEFCDEVYANVSKRGVIDEHFLSQTLSGKKLKKEEREKKSESSEKGK